jgi:putative ABC transport system permease protein
VVRKVLVVLRRIGDIFSAPRRESRLDGEIRGHLESLTDDYMRRGLARADAEAAARRDFGGVEQIKEQYRDTAGMRFVDDVVRDMRYALRSARRSPVFTFVALISLAIGVGVNCAAFSWADALLLRPLPIARPSEVVTVGSVLNIEGAGIGASLIRASYPEFVDVRNRSRSFEGVSVYNGTTAAVATRADEAPILAVGYLVDAGFFSTLGVPVVMGRAFRAEEGDVPGRDAVMILGHRFWQRQFGGDEGVIGRTIRVNGIEFTVIGVLPASFTSIEPSTTPDFFAPIMMWPRLRQRDGIQPLEARDLRYLSIKARLKRGVDLGQAQAELALLSRDMAREHPESERGRDLRVRTELQNRIAELPPLLSLNVMLMTLAMAVLIVSCANVAGLLTSRAPARAREMATRLAIGAGRARLIRQMLTESALLALFGGVLGLAAAVVAVHAFQVIRFPTDISVGYTFQFDGRVALFGTALAIGSMVLFAVLPAQHTSRVSPMNVMKDAEASLGRTWGRGVLVVTQVAISVVLLVVASFIYRAFRVELTTGPGYRIDHLLMMRFDPTLLHTGDAGAHRFYDALTTRVRSVSGVTSVALTGIVPMQLFGLDSTSAAPEGYRVPSGSPRVLIVSTVVDENYFDTMRIPIVRGRAFSVDDTPDRARVVIVNEVVAKHYWPGQDPIGRRLWLPDDHRPGQHWTTVVGVAKTSKYLFLAEPPLEYVYFPYRQTSAGSMVLLVQSEGDPSLLAAPIRELARGIDPRQPIFDVRTMEDFYQISTVSSFAGVIRTVAIMGVMGLTLALVGLYSLVAYSASRRTKEIGIRIALGAGRTGVLRMLLQQAVALTIAGLTAGLAASIGAGLLLQRAFPDGGRGPQSDNVSLAIVAPVVLVVVLTAACIPAWRASRTDPMVALRYE